MAARSREAALASPDADTPSKATDFPHALWGDQVFTGEATTTPVAANTAAAPATTSSGGVLADTAVRPGNGGVLGETAVAPAAANGAVLAATGFPIGLLAVGLILLASAGLIRVLTPHTETR